MRAEGMAGNAGSLMLVASPESCLLAAATAEGPQASVGSGTALPAAAPATGQHRPEALSFSEHAANCSHGRIGKRSGLDLHQERLARAVELILGARDICVIGLRRAFPVAAYASTAWCAPSSARSPISSRCAIFEVFSSTRIRARPSPCCSTPATILRSAS